MKTLSFLCLVAVLTVSCARAKSPMIVEITTTDAGASFTFNASPKTPVELENLLREIVTRWGIDEPILVRPDSRTSFQTVFEILQRLKAAGVPSYEVQAGGGQNGNFYESHSLRVTKDNVVFERLKSPQWPKPR